MLLYTILTLTWCLVLRYTWYSTSWESWHVDPVTTSRSKVVGHWQRCEVPQGRSCSLPLCSRTEPQDWQHAQNGAPKRVKAKSTLNIKIAGRFLVVDVHPPEYCIAIDPKVFSFYKKLYLRHFATNQQLEVMQGTSSTNSLAIVIISMSQVSSKELPFRSDRKTQSASHHPKMRWLFFPFSISCHIEQPSLLAVLEWPPREAGYIEYSTCNLHEVARISSGYTPTYLHYVNPPILICR